MKIKLINIFESLKDKERYEASEHDIAEELGIYHNLECDKCKIEYAYLTSWTCTDTTVGIAAYWLDGEPAFITTQKARKSDKFYYWVSKEMYKKVYAYIESLVEEEDLFWLIDNMEAEILDCDFVITEEEW